MSVEFNEPGMGGSTSGGYPVSQSQTSAMIRLVMKTGLATDEQSANKVLLGIAVACFILTGFVLVSSFL